MLYSVWDSVRETRSLDAATDDESTRRRDDTKHRDDTRHGDDDTGSKMYFNSNYQYKPFIAPQTFFSCRIPCLFGFLAKYLES